MAIIDISTYFLVAVFLILQRGSLVEYNITSLAVWLLILFKPIQTLIQTHWETIYHPIRFPTAFPKLPGLLIWVIALALLLIFWKQITQKRVIRWQDWKGLLIGILAGLGLVLITAYPGSFTVGSSNPVSKNSIVADLLQGTGAIPYHIGYAAITEEPVFRGFLRGWLRKVGWREVWIWLFQAGIFALAHLYYLKSAPLMFWFSVPLGGLVLGWLAWRYRSIAVSMAAHGVANGLSRTMELVFAALKG